MTEDNSLSPPSRSSERQRTHVGIAEFFGFLLAATGLVLGLVTAFKRKEAECADGTYFPEGTTDFRCFVHPQAFEGTALAVVSVMLGILIYLTVLIARSTLASSSDRKAL